MGQRERQGGGEGETGWREWETGRKRRGGAR